MADTSRQTMFDPTLLPDEQESIQFLARLSRLEQTILASHTTKGIRLVAEFRDLPFSVVARHAIKAAVALKKFQ